MSLIANDMKIMRNRWMGRFGLPVIMATFLASCAGVSQEQLANMATVEVASGFSMHSVDSQVKLFTDSVNVEPGVHVFEMTMNCYNNNCTYQAYRFMAEAGYLYRLMPDRTVLVLDRNDRYQRKLDELTPIVGIEYGNRKMALEAAEKKARFLEKARQATLERRKMNLHLVRKPGAKICRVQSEFLYIGFVEDVTEDKVQIRVAEQRIDADRSLVATNFKPAIIWDSPLNWELCE